MGESVNVEIKVRKLGSLGIRLEFWLKRYVGRFKSALSKLHRAIDDEIYEIKRAQEWGPKYTKYIRDLQELNLRHESRNTEGQPLDSKPLLPGQVRLIPEALKDPDEYFEAKKKLDMEYAEAIEEEEKRVSDFAKHLNETITITVKHLIRTEDYLEELSEMNGEDYDLLSPFLDKDLDEFDLSKVEENRTKKLEKENENKAKVIEELRKDNNKLEDRIVELKEKLAKIYKKKEE